MTNILSSSCSQLTKKQTEILEAVFITNTRPDISTRDGLAKTLKLSNLLIHVWFQNRRLRLRRSPPQRVVSQTSPVDVISHPIDLSVSSRTTGIPRSSIDVTDHPIDLSISDKASRKRKSPCDINDRERTPLPCKKSATIPTAMTSSSYQSYGCCGAIRSEASRDTPSDATSSLMSVDFLSRSSRTESMPSRDVGHFFRTPMFCPSAAFPYITYYRC